MGFGIRLTFATALLTLLLIAIVPRTHKIRPRASLLFCIASAVFSLLALSFPQVSAGRRMLEGLAAVTVALAVGHLIFVLVVDVVLERLGRAPMNQLLRDGLRVAAYLVAALSGMRASGIEASSILATGTVLTAVVGFALQETLGNLAAGAAIQIDRPFEVGDWIRIDKGDLTGRVVSANWRSVTIQGDDRLHFVVPNGFIARYPFTNYSRPGGSCRRSLYVTIPNDVPPPRVVDAVMAACSDCSDVLSDPPPSLLPWLFTENGVQYWLRFYIADFAARDRAAGAITTRIWFHLHRDKIELAIPPRRAWVQSVDDEARAKMEEDVVRDRRAAIDAVDFLRPLSETARDRLARRGHRKLFARGETIIRAGEHGRELFLMRRGSVVIRVDTADVARLGPGDFFGELALLTGKERHADVVAEVETEVFEIDEKMFEEVLQSEPKIIEEMSRIVAERQAELTARASGNPLSKATTHAATADILSKIRSVFGL